MRTQLRNKKTNSYQCMDGWAEWDEYEYSCPCGKGKIIETHDDTPSNREHFVELLCDECKKRYKIDTSKGIRKWELEKIELDMWDEFLNQLEENNYTKEKKYLEAIKFVSEINVKEIDDQEYREKIKEKLYNIVQFIDEKKTWYEISLIQGFRIEEKIDGRDYYYYIADQQMKATVYYARYLNFINNCILKQEYKDDIEKIVQSYCEALKISSDEITLEERCKTILSKLEESTEVLFDNSQDAVNNEIVKNVVKSNEYEKQRIQIELIRYLEKWEIANNIEYKIYMMFNNMMREIRFFGAAYQYLWHWHKHKKNLYRSGTLVINNQDNNTIYFDEPKSKQKFLKEMFENCIDHMNAPSKVRHSFSENLLLDIYKYLILDKPNTDITESEVKNENGLKITCNVINNAHTVEFNIIKNANINSIFTEANQALSFYEYVVGKKSEIVGYSVEMYPQDLSGERNDKGTVKGMRDTLLPLYFASWGINASLSKTKVADDKEVITYGKCYKGDPIKVENSSTVCFKDAENGTIFNMELDKNDIICLLLKIYKKKKKQTEDCKAVEAIVKEIVQKMKFSDQLKGEFKNYFERKSSEWRQKLIFDKVDVNPFVIEIKANKQYWDNISPETTLQKASEQLKSSIEKYTQEYLKKRYCDIIQSYKFRADFILSTISDNEFTFELICKYNEYMAKQEDSEITMLKYLIFKEV